MTHIRTAGLVIIGVTLTLTVGLAQQPKSASTMMQTAEQKMTVEGDARGAIKIYQDVVSQYGTSDRAAAATALLKMAEVYEKLGDPLASTTLQQLLTNYSDQAAAGPARARLSGGMPRAVCDNCGDVFAAISPDGRAMATVMPYLEAGENFGDIGLIDTSTGKLSPIHLEGSGKRDGVSLFPVFSPDGREIAFMWGKQDRTNLRVVPRQGGKWKALSNGPYELVVPEAWQAASILIAGRKADKTVELALVSPSGEAVTPIKTLGFGMVPAPHVANLSRDGRYVAFERFTTDPPMPVNGPTADNMDRQIHVMKANGSGDVTITTGAGVKRWPVFTPSGSHVLYVSNVTGVWDLWAMAIRDGQPVGQPVLVKKSVGDIVGLSVTNANQYFFYEGRNGVFKSAIAPIGSAGTRASSTPETFIGGQPAWSPDGKTVALGRARADGSSNDVVVHTLANGDERVFKRDGILSFPYIWYPDGSGLLVQVREAPNVQFWYRLDIATGEFRRLVQQRGSRDFWTHQNIRTLSADGRTLFFGTYANVTDPEIDRITALDLATGTYRDVFRLPVEKEGLPRGGQDLALSASPDGRSLAVLQWDRKLRASHLGIVGVDGQGYHELVPPFQTESVQNMLRWSHDGKWIYFIALPPNTSKTDHTVYRVMRVAATGGTPEAIGLESDSLNFFDISPDGTRIAYSSLRPEGAAELIWSLDVSWLLKGQR